jgi:protein-S-isoprenylcysteine O-methyltransferase Ste14
MSNVYLRSFGSVVLVLALMGALVFLPAWTLRYWQAWAFLAVCGVAWVMIIGDLVRRDRALLERRMAGGPTAETRASQRIIMSITSLGFCALLVVPGFDHRFGWSTVPAAVSIAADAVALAGWLVILLVFRENTFTASTIEVAKDQRVISTGPYAIVRHPMYSGSLLYVVAMPVALGSWWALLAIVPVLPFFVWRIFDEEGLLTRDLAGYPQYAGRVRYRLLPHVW